MSPIWVYLRPMNEKKSEPALADQARTALLEAVITAAETGNGEAARDLAEAYVIIDKAAPRQSGGVPAVVQSTVPRRR